MRQRSWRALGRFELEWHSPSSKYGTHACRCPMWRKIVRNHRGNCLRIVDLPGPSAMWIQWSAIYQCSRVHEGKRKRVGSKLDMRQKEVLLTAPPTSYSSQLTRVPLRLMSNECSFTPKVCRRTFNISSVKFNELALNGNVNVNSVYLLKVGSQVQLYAARFLRNYSSCDETMQLP